MMRARIVSNSCIKGPYYKLTIKPSCTINSLPGQFLMIRDAGYPNSTDPLLPRPFSIHKSTSNGNIEILYKVVGKRTNVLSRRNAGDEIEFLGPLGNGFPIDRVESIADSIGEILIVAGGIGVAPMLGLAETLKANYSDKWPDKEITVFLGGNGEVDLLCVEELRKVALKVILTTNDGVIGIKGYVTEALEEYLYCEKRQETFPTLYACGPSPMLQRILEITRPLNIDTYFSLEATMACGIGICMGCAVKRVDGGYYLVCKDGPVFSGKTIEL